MDVASPPSSAGIARAMRPLLIGSLAVFGAACFAGRPTEVSPEEIPDIEARLAQEPNNSDLLLRYAAALFAAQRCDSASAVALRGGRLRPSSALAPMVIGQCLEQAGNHDQAIALYQSFTAQYGNARGAAAVRAREMLARRDRATAGARAALAREQELATQPADARTVAILPLIIAGDSSFQPLGRGLAQMLISDLALIQQFRMVERLQVGALMQELQLSQTDRIDQSTAARLGRLVRAGRMVQGLAAIPPEGEVRLEANVVAASGQVTGPEVATGRFRDLLRMEKDLAIGISSRLGYQLSLAERQRILENGTQNLTAFLAYSRGLVAEDLGDYATAAVHFSTAVQSDPGFQQARTQHEAATAAPAVQSATAGQVTTVSVTTVTPPDVGVTGDAVINAVASAVGDVAATQAEQTTKSAEETQATQQTTQQSATTSASKPPETTTGEGTTTTITGTVRIIFRLP